MPRVVQVFTKLLAQENQDGKRHGQRNAQVPYPSYSQQSLRRKTLAV